ncbi:hypothetical protein BGZ60DRAFT_555786, partial [Tricladium varicosporioides]
PLASIIKPIVLILGAGPSLGHYTATVFAEKSWRVASASRSCKDQLLDSRHLDLHVDFTDLNSAENVLYKVKRLFGEFPTVFIYNGFARSFHDANDPWSTITKADVEREMNANTNSALIAAQ